MYVKNTYHAQSSSSSVLDIVILGLEHMKVLKPSGCMLEGVSRL
jgi:hypothetical protein